MDEPTSAPSTGWEYASLMSEGPASRDQLNQLGSDGWELTSVVRADQPGGTVQQFLYVFKRRT